MQDDQVDAPAAAPAKTRGRAKKEVG